MIQLPTNGIGESRGTSDEGIECFNLSKQVMRFPVGDLLAGLVVIERFDESGCFLEQTFFEKLLNFCSIERSWCGKVIFYSSDDMNLEIQ